MYEEYIKDTKIIEKNDNDKKIELLNSVIKAKIDLENANKNFEFAEDDLIDYYTYQIKATQSKLNYLLKKVKKEGLILDMINEIEIRTYKNNDAV